MESLVPQDLQQRILETKSKLKSFASSGNSLTHKLVNLISLTKELYPAQQIDSGTLRGWLPLWKTLAERHGFDVLEEAVTRHMLADQFFPLPAALSKQIDFIIGEKAKRRSGPKFIACGREELGPNGKPGVIYGGAQCVGGMWVYLAIAHHENGIEMYSGTPQRWARECDCLKAWRAEKATAVPETKGNRS